MYVGILARLHLCMYFCMHALTHAGVYRGKLLTQSLIASGSAGFQQGEWPLSSNTSCAKPVQGLLL